MGTSFNSNGLLPDLIKWRRWTRWPPNLKNYMKSLLKGWFIWQTGLRSLSWGRLCAGRWGPSLTAPTLVRTIKQKTALVSNYRSTNTNLPNLSKKAATSISGISSAELKHVHKAKRNIQRPQHTCSHQRKTELTRKLCQFCLDALANHLRSPLATIKMEKNISRPH